MNLHRSTPWFLAAALVAAPGAFAAPPASGTVTIDGERWTVADAAAYPEGDATTVVFSNAVFDRREFAKDGKLDSFDLMRHAGGGTQNFSITIGEDGSFKGYGKQTGNGGGGGYNSTIADGFALESRSGGRVKGRIAFEDEDLAADVAFDLPVESTLARAGTPLPAGGGAIGTAALAHFEAMASADAKRILAMVPPDRRAEQEAMMADPESAEMIGFLAAMTPRKAVVTGGTQDGDRATLDFTGEDADGGKLKGTVEGTRIEGRWYFNGVSTTSGD